MLGTVVTSWLALQDRSVITSYNVCLLQERVLVHPQEESLDFVGENRIVFVGDFDITLSNNLLTRNNRLYSHSVSERFVV